MEDPPRLPLPDDVLADVLARLPPRSLAVSRCVCREWRAVVDDRHLLRPDLLPLTVGGVFVEAQSTENPDFFAQPSTARSHWVAGRLMSLVRMDANLTEIAIVDCCNGLFQLEDDEEYIVVNSATGRSARLPPCNDLPEGPEGGGLYRSYLAFDPTVSPHYEVISMQHPFNVVVRMKMKRWGELQWPPPVYPLRAYSSRRGRWEERRFAPDNDNEGLHRSISGLNLRVYGHTAYWRGVLYVHCNSDFILRLNLSDDKYQVIDLPAEATARHDLCEVYLGKSKNGIYFTAITNDPCQVFIWFFDESDGKEQWVLKHEIILHGLVTHLWDNPDAQTDRPWILQDSDSHNGFKLEVEKDSTNLDWESDDDDSAVNIKDYYDLTMEKEKNVDWNSDDEGTIDIKDYCDTENTYEFIILGFHPYREIVFLYSSRVVAYHFNTSKVRDLGKLGLKYFEHIGSTTFIYAPCWVGDLSETS